MTITTDFPGSSVPSGWSTITPLSSAVAVADGWLGITVAGGESYDTVTASSSSQGSPGISHPIPAGPFDIAVQVSDDIGDTKSWGYNLLASDGAGGWARFAVHRPNDNSEAPRFFVASRPTGGGAGTNHYNTTVNSPPAALQSGTPAFLRLAFNGTDTFQPYYSTDGVTYVALNPFTRALTPTTFYVVVTSTTPNTAGALRVAAVFDILALGTTDLRTRRPTVGRASKSAFDGTVAALPIGWSNDSIIDAPTFQAAGGTALRLATDNTQVGSRCRIQGDSLTGYRSAGLFLRADVPTFSSNSFATFGLMTITGDGDVYVPDGGGYGCERGNTAFRPIRIDDPTGSNVASVPGSTGLDEKRYAWLADTTHPAISGNGIRCFRFERICQSVTPGGIAWWRVKEWASVGNLAADLAAEPAAWDYEFQDDIERGLLLPVIAVAHNNPTGGLTGTAQLDLLNIDFYQLQPGIDAAERTATAQAFGRTKARTLGAATRAATALGFGRTKRRAVAAAGRTATAQAFGAVFVSALNPRLVEVTELSTRTDASGLRSHP